MDPLYLAATPHSADRKTPTTAARPNLQPVHHVQSNRNNSWLASINLDSAPDNSLHLNEDDTSYEAPKDLDLRVVFIFFFLFLTRNIDIEYIPLSLVLKKPCESFCFPSSCRILMIPFQTTASTEKFSEVYLRY